MACVSLESVSRSNTVRKPAHKRFNDHADEMLPSQEHEIAGAGDFFHGNTLSLILSYSSCDDSLDRAVDISHINPMRTRQSVERTWQRELTRNVCMNAHRH